MEGATPKGGCGSAPWTISSIAPTAASTASIPTGAVERQFDGVIVSNTVALSPTQDTLYFSDTRRFTTWQFSFDLGRGALSEPQDLNGSLGGPGSTRRGMLWTLKGFIWVAHFGSGRVVRHAPSGAVDRVIELPVTNPTCVCLGGPHLKTLFITSARKFLSRPQLQKEPLAGSVLAVNVDVPGLPEHRFGYTGQPVRGRGDASLRP